MAHFSEDPLLLQVYREGHDIYQVTAQGIFGRAVEKDSSERGIAKTLVLAMGYGAGPGKVAQILTVNGFPTHEQTARGYLNELQSLYATFFNWREAVIARVKQKGYVTTLGGRHRRLKAAFEDRRNWKNVGYGERQAVNAVVQGSAGDIVRRVMVSWRTRGDKCFRGGFDLLAQVHDELVWEANSHFFDDELGRLRRFEDDGGSDHGWNNPIYLDWLRDSAENDHRFKLAVPLVFEPHFGQSWFAAKEGIDLPEDLNEESTGYEEDA
jgi:DNA polymerase-1